MKVIISLILLFTSLTSHAALFDFTSTNPTFTSNQASAWAVDLAAARQWYIAWAASADRVYDGLINPGNLTAPGSGMNLNTALSQAVFAAILAMFMAALLSATKSVSKVVRVRQIVRTAS
jgi:hypothetical protein